MQTQMRHQARQRMRLRDPSAARSLGRSAAWPSGCCWGWRGWHHGPPWLAESFVEEGLTLDPAADVYEESDEVIVKVDVPGLEGDDLSVSLSDDLLTITGERKYDVEPEGREYDLQERTAGDFCRRLRVPIPVDAEKARASYRQGVLEIHLPKAQEAKGNKISIAVT